MATSWHVNVVNWSKLDDREAVKAIREKVFIDEQHVPVELEWDGLDQECLHLLASDSSGTKLATARMHIQQTTAQIGRMAVLKPYRQQEIGSQLLKKLLEQARLAGVEEVRLNAQTTAIGFYQRFGFTIEGNEFQDAGIPHYKMLLNIR